MFDESRLSNCLKNLGADSTAGIFARLSDAYGEAGRFYHDTTHIEECLTHLSKHVELAGCPAEVEAAIWFHDAVYDTKAADNEEQSADWASEYLLSVGVEAEAISRIHSMIIATKTHVAETLDQKLMLDIDLGILGSSEPSFERYDQAIRKEYEWVPLPQYTQGRIGILQKFLDRPAIYQTSHFHSQLEQTARANLARKINELRDL